MMVLPKLSKKFKDRFSRFDTIPACDRQPASHVAVASTRYAYLRRAVKSNYRIFEQSVSQSSSMFLTWNLPKDTLNRYLHLISSYTNRYTIVNVSTQDFLRLPHIQIADRTENMILH